ncbi:MAG TPA: hypothetical protein VHV55_12975 [Pirellulales bacterium]|jgi:hypothetical protein|nr:hypothetical protein [Pirellulales bacterium]
MIRMVVKATVGSDGSLHLDLPIGAAEAGKEVQVTVDPVPSAVSREEWRAWVQSMAGSWQGDFERPPQGQLEEREPLE